MPLDLAQPAAGAPAGLLGPPFLAELSPTSARGCGPGTPIPTPPTFCREGVIGVITVAEDLIKLIGDLIPLILPLLGL
jgi:hypothetical protein